MYSSHRSLLAQAHLPHAPSRVVAVEVGELPRKDEVLQHRLPEEGQVTLPGASLVIVGRPGGVKGVDDEVGGQPGEELDDGHTDDPLPVEVLEGRFDLAGRLAVREHLQRADGRMSESER